MLHSRVVIASERRQAIFDKIMCRVRVDPVTGCWEWLGPTSGKAEKGKTGRDYARMNLDGQTVAVHIVMWVNVHGYLPRKKQLDHECRNRKCVNPYPGHTRKMTHKQNMKARDAHAKS